MVSRKVIQEEEEDGQVTAVDMEDHNQPMNVIENKTVLENRTSSQFYEKGFMISADETENDDDDDSQDAFDDIEDEETLCGEVTNETRKKVFPSAVIIGTKKEGTRALLEFLNMHSLVRRSKHETHFYDKNYAKGTAWYVEQMPEIFAGQISLEKTPGYFHTPGVPQRIFSTQNSTKLILIVRNPVTRLISDYNQFRSNTLARNMTYPPLEELVTTQAGAVSEQYPPVQRSMYHKHMKSWLSIFPRQQIMVVDGDNFIQQPWAEQGRVEKFLDLPHH